MGQSYLKNITQKQLYDEIGTVLLDNIKLRIREYFDQEIPNRIAAGEALIENIQRDLRDPKEVREDCHETESCILPIYGRILLAYNDIFEEKLIPKHDVKTGQAHDNNCEIRLEGCWYRAAVNKQKCLIDTESGLATLAQISILRKCQHDNLVKIYGISSFDGFKIYMELCNTTLDNKVIVGKLEWEKCTKYLEETLEGLNYMHHCGLVHKNIRLENIQIKDNNAKLSGGGISDLESLTGKIEGIPIIRAPEVRQNSYCGYEADMFQIGVVLWECWYKNRAFCEDEKPENSTYEDLYSSIIDGNWPMFPLPEPDDNLYSVIKSCLDINPDARPSAKEVRDCIRL